MVRYRFNIPRHSIALPFTEKGRHAWRSCILISSELTSGLVASFIMKNAETFKLMLFGAFAQNDRFVCGWAFGLKFV